MKQALQDTSFAVLFDKRDVPTIQKMIEKVNLNIFETNEISDNFNQICEKNWNDHRNRLLEVGNKKVELLQVSKSDDRDLVVNAGANQLVDLMRGGSSTRFSYVGKGTSSTSSSVSQTALVSESGSRVNIIPAGTGFFGWAQWRGMSLKYAGLFGETTATINVTEAGVFTASSGGTMLARDVYIQAPLNHQLNYSAYLISFIVDMVPKAVGVLG